MGIGRTDAEVNFPNVMAKVRGVIARAYCRETLEALAKQGIEVAIGSVRLATTRLWKLAIDSAVGISSSVRARRPKYRPSRDLHERSVECDALTWRMWY